MLLKLQWLSGPVHVLYFVQRPIGTQYKTLVLVLHESKLMKDSSVSSKALMKVV